MNKYFLITACLGLFAMSSAYAQMNPTVANAKLSSYAKQKVKNGGINLDAMLKNNSNDLIVEYDLSTNHQNTSQARQYYQEQKQKLQTYYKRQGGFELLREYNALPISFHRIQNRDTLVQLLNDPSVKAVYPNRTMYTTTDKSYELIGQTEAAIKGFKGDGTTVAILDSGANYRHADFGSCTAAGVPSTCKISHSIEIARDDYSLDSNGHGSNVAGIISKVAPNTKIVAMDVFNGQTATDSNLISALNWVANNAKTLNIKAVNLSLGDQKRYSSTCTNSSLTNAFTSLRNAGVIPVVASGNDGHTTGISYPACTAGAVSVAAVYDSNIGSIRTSSCSDSSTYSDKVVCFSNTGSNLTLLAPGVLMSAGGYTQSGTSQAAPHVTAAIAVLRSSNAFPNETLNQTIDRLKSTGTLVTDHRNSLKIPRLNLLAAVNGATNTLPPVVEQPSTPPIVTPTPAPSTQQQTCINFIFFKICSG